MSKDKELKPCPFCGGVNLKIGDTSCSMGTDIYIKCTCGAKFQIPEEFGEEQLITWWNRRTDDVPISQHDKETD